MELFNHPRQHLAPVIVSQLRQYSARAERRKQLNPEQWELVFQQKWLKMFLPSHLGGLELDLLQALKLQESIAWADSSVGWTITLCAGANWFAGFLPAEMVMTWFTNPRICVAGSGSPSGRARKFQDGYHVKGYWHHATGIHQAQIITANCILEAADGTELKDPEGKPLVRPFWFYRGEVEIRETWNPIGLRATGSDSFTVYELQVPPDRCFEILPEKAILAQPVFQVPFTPLAETTLAMNHSGMAFHFVDLLEEMITIPENRLEPADKDKREKREWVKREIAGFLQNLNACRRELLVLAEANREKLAGGQAVPEEHWLELGRLSRVLATEARKGVDRLYPYGGMMAAMHDSDLSRVWRDIHTASQHSLLLPYQPINTEVKTINEITEEA